MKSFIFFFAILGPVAALGENEIGFIERFALAADREKALGELVPGTADYYLYHALHYQNTRDTGKLNEMLSQWRKRSPGEDAQRRMIENREAILNYERDPKETVAYLTERLGVRHDHQQQRRDQKPDLPTQLDPGKIAREVFLADSLKNDASLQSFSQAALAALIRDETPLTAVQRRAVLQKLERPDVPHLVQAILTDLQVDKGRSFGDLQIHRALLPDQLDAMLTARPDLIHQQAFVFTRLRKLAPSADVDLAYDDAEREAWLDRVWAFVQKLPPAQNTLKARVLFLRLEHDRKKGVYDQMRFTEYLKLPRPVRYINALLLKNAEPSARPDLNADLSEPLLLSPPIGNDEALVRDYFLHFFAQEAKAEPDLAALLAPWTAWVRDTWLRPILAEALVVNGIGEAARWAALITPAEFQKLKERVDIDFPATNKPAFQPGDDIRFDVELKNTPKLIVKIFELNTLNFFQTQKRQLNTDVNLDGLVANSEQTLNLDEGPFKRTRQTFHFPELKGRRGAWIIEFIGGGRSSRALVRVGQWQVLQETGQQGDLITVLDEKNQLVPDAVAWFEGRKLMGHDKQGRIVIPFTEEPGRKPLVIGDAAGSFATLTEFQHHAEEYKLDAQFHIEREQLLAGREATLAVRAVLMAGDTRISPEHLVGPKLTITSTTREGVSTTQEVKNLKLTAAGVLTHPFTVPERLAMLTIILAGKVEVPSRGGEKVAMEAREVWNVNDIDKTEAVADGHLSTFAGQRVYELLGKNGEPIADQQIVFKLKHREFFRQQTVALRSDEKGRIMLGPLEGISEVTAQTPAGRTNTWQILAKDPSVIHETVQIAEGDEVQIPLLGNGGISSASLLAVGFGTYQADFSSRIERKDGHLIITGLKAGDYTLSLSGEEIVSISVAAGDRRSGWVIGRHRSLQVRGAAPLHITQVEEDSKFIVVRLANSGPFARVHVAATRFDPGLGIAAELSRFIKIAPASGTPARLPNLYSAGREIGDEYRYILERRYAKAYPGNMLPRPGLLLNPWERRSTEPEALLQNAGRSAGSTSGDASASSNPASYLLEKMGRYQSPEQASNLDFLATAAPVIYNLMPDKDGVVRIDRRGLGDRQHIQIYASDLENASWRTITLPESNTKFSDQRFARNLDPAKPFTQKKEITFLTAGQSLTLADLLTSEMETYDTLGGVHFLFTTLSGNPNLAKFAFILDWPKLSAEEKRAKYDEHACHELSFFLQRKDKAFFEAVVKPYLANKKDKTFMDDYLLECDLQHYLKPWAYAQLNIVERILLGQRIETEAPNAARHVRELWEMIPPKPEETDRLFETALRGRALEDGGKGTFGDLRRVQRAITISGGVSTSISGEIPKAEAMASTPADPFSSTAASPLANKNSRDVQQNLLLANNALEAGHYDQAIIQFQNVLRTDPYNMAARRGMERVESKRAEYFDSARDHQRTRMLNMVNEAWEDKPPRPGLIIDQTARVTGTRIPEPHGYLTKKMQSIIFPRVNFSGVSIEEALEFLRTKSRDLDTTETDPSKKGINIILRAGEAVPTAQISLDLKDVPLSEAIRYVTDLTGMNYKVEPYAIVVVPVSETTTEQYTRVYKVPPNFLSLGSGAGMNALQILKAQGIPFPDGAAAVFNEATSQLVVKNTEPNLDLVATFVEANGGSGPPAPGLAENRLFYRHLGPTKELAENNYYQLGIDQQKAGLITVNAFWRDYAAWVASGSKARDFVSTNIAEAAGSFSEMMLALAVLDLPFESAKHATKTDKGQFTFTAGGPCIVFHKEIKPAAGSDAAQGHLLISQSFFRQGDRYRQEGNEKYEKYVTTEFLTGVAYGANVVVTNPASSPVKAVVLLQIPQGALPVLGSKETESKQVRLAAYTTQTFEYFFYFPQVPAKAGLKFAHFPVNVSTSTGTATTAKPFQFNVVAKLTDMDKASWDYLSQYGTEAEVFAFLEQNNIASLNLARVAWRCRQSGAFYQKLVAFMRTHHVSDNTISSYALVYNDAATLGEWLKMRGDFGNQCGPYLASALLTLDPIERRSYEHLEYAPLVNQRAHRIGGEWRIANPALLAEYRQLLLILAFKPQLDAMDNLSVTYFLFLQDRIEEALARFRMVDAAKLPTRLQHDYIQCYAAFYEGDAATARGLAAKYADCPVPRWRLLFADVKTQLDEIDGTEAKIEKGGKPDREKQQAELAGTEPGFEFKVENKSIDLHWRNLREVTLNYYLMDPEFSFSSNPFISGDSSRFSIIKPNKTSLQTLPDGKAGTLAIPMPGEFSKANVLVEVIGAGLRKTQAYHSNSLNLALSENYGRLETRDVSTGKALPKAYVKVYARLKDGAIRFFKDGYTDLRGRFDYSSLNGSAASTVTDSVSPSGPSSEAAPASGLDYPMLKSADIQKIDKLAILVLSDNHGATVREVNPPGR